MALTGQTAYLDAFYWKLLGLRSLSRIEVLPALHSSVITGAVVTVVVSAAALALAFRSDGKQGARPFGLALAAWAYLLAYSGLTLLLAPAPGTIARDFFDAHFLFVEALALAALLRFTAVFPVPLRGVTIRDGASLHPLLRPAQRIRAALLTPLGPWVAGALACVLILAVNAWMGRPVEDAPLIVPADLCRFAALSVVVLNLRASFVAADTPGRRSGFWFVVGFTLLLGAVGVLLGGIVLTAVTEWTIPGFNWRPAVLDLGVLGLLWGAYRGIAYRGIQKPGPVARRAAVLVSAATLALFLAAGLESFLTGIVSSPVTLPRGVGTLVAFVAIGILYRSVHGPVESMLYHAWADPPDDAPHP